MDIWVVGTSNQHFLAGSYTEIKFQKNKVVTGKTPFCVVDPFCTPHSICLSIGFWEYSFIRKFYAFNLSILHYKNYTPFY